MRQRWLPVGVLALAIFLINAIARFISFKFAGESQDWQNRLVVIGVAGIAVLLFAAAIRWALRFPFSRLVGDIGLALIAGTILVMVAGPYIGGTTPLANGLEFFVDELFVFLAIGLGSAFLGFIVVVAIGKDWRSKGLKRYEQHYARKPHRTARG